MQQAISCPLFILLLFLSVSAFSQSPYLGGKGDGYAARFSTISAIQQAVAPAWMRVYPSPVKAGEPLVVVVFDVSDEVVAHLFDVQGKRLQAVAKTGVLGEQYLRLETKGLAAGVYCLRVRRGADAFTQKIIVWAD